MQSHENLEFWRKAVDLSVLIYKMTEHFPSRELYGIVSQMRRAAVSIPSNIAEGRRRGTDPDFRHFLRTSHGSLAELETQLLISKELSFLNAKEYEAVLLRTSEVSKMLRAMIKALA